MRKLPKTQRLLDWNMLPIEAHMEDYSLFLRDEDFDKYMPLIFEHDKRNETYFQKMLVRALWIRGRLPTQGTIKRSFYEGLFNVEFQKLKAMLE